MAYRLEELDAAYAQAQTLRIDLTDGGLEIDGVFHKALPKGLLKDKKVIIGATSDPLFPFEKTLHPCLGLLTMLAEEEYQSLELRTCSPLILLATPVLKQFREKLLVSLKIFKDSKSKLPFPRKEEVLAVANVLQQHSLKVEISFHN